MGGNTIFRMPAEIKFSGTLPFDLLEQGMVVRFNASVSRGGKSKGEINKLRIVDVPADQFQVTGSEEPKSGKYIELRSYRAHFSCHQEQTDRCR